MDSAYWHLTCAAGGHAPLCEVGDAATIYGPTTTWHKEVAADAISFFPDVDPFLDLEYMDSLVPVPGGGGAPLAMFEPACNLYSEHLISLPAQISSSEVGEVPDDAFADAPNNHSRPIRNTTATLDREARVMRYREKRKNRKFEKTIRYASRKAYAETRPRMKGRFVKRVDADSDADPIYSFPLNGYGVVPSFFEP